MKDIYPGSTSSNASQFFPYEGGVLLSAFTNSSADELWASNGTLAGTQMLRDINPGAVDSSPSGFTRFKGAAYFVAKTASAGNELWVTRGTLSSTHMVRDLMAGASGSNPDALAAVGPLLTFMADSGTGNGYELWQTDGSALNTTLAKDISAGAPGSYPRAMSVVGNTIFFDAEDVAHGDELWAYTTLQSSTTAFPKSSYSKSIANAKKIYVTVKVYATGTTPSGKVILKEGTKTIGSGTLHSGSTSAQITVKLSTGPHFIVAFYTGSLKARRSNSFTFNVKVN